MTIERMLCLIAGSFILISITLGYFVSPWFYVFTALVGLNLFQSGSPIGARWCGYFRNSDTGGATRRVPVRGEHMATDYREPATTVLQ